jgi:hypothetical protein
MSVKWESDDCCAVACNLPTLFILSSLWMHQYLYPNTWLLTLGNHSTQAWCDDKHCGYSTSSITWKSSQEMLEMCVYVGAWDREVSSSAIKLLSGLYGILEFQSCPGLHKERSLSLSLSCLISSTGQLICHPVHGQSQSEGGLCPKGGGNSSWEPRRNDGESATPEQPSSESWSWSTEDWELEFEDKDSLWANMEGLW